MAGLLQDLFGMPAAGVAPNDVTDELLARARRLNDGIVTAQAVAPQVAAPVAVPPLETRAVREYPIAEARPPAAAMPAPVQAPQPAPMPTDGPSLGDRLGRFLMAGSQGSIARGLGEATYGADRTAETQNLTVQLLTQKGMDPMQARALARSPEMLKTILPTLFGPKPGAVQVAPGGAIVNPATGQVLFRNEDAKPGLHNVAPGATAIDASGKPVFTAPAAPEKQTAPAGYEWIDPNDKSKGVAAIPGGPATKGTGEMAGKLALMRTSRDAIRATRSKLENGWGVTGALQSGLSDVLPSVAGEIGEAQRNVRAGIEAALRIMTGAAAPEAEVVRYMNLFAPNARDSTSSAKQKLDMLERFMDEAEALARQGHQTKGEMAQQPRPAASTGAPRGAADPLGIR